MIDTSHATALVVLPEQLAVSGASGIDGHVLRTILIVAVGTIAALATGMLTRLDGGTYPTAVIRGGVAFGGTITVAVLLANALHQI